MKNNNQNENKGFQHHDHKKPVTRRDFLEQGIISGVGMVMMPTVGQMVLGASKAHAAPESCGTTGGVGAGKIPYIGLDLAGGASISGSNVLVGGQGGQMDFISEAGYRKLGLPSDMLPSLPGQVNTELGLAFHSDSAFLRGIQSITSAETRANINGAIFCARSDNDTGNNPHNPIYGINKAGADGALVPLIGTQNSNSGGRSQAPASMIDPSKQPTKVDRPEDAIGLVDTGKLVEMLDGQEAVMVMNAIEQVSAMKLDKMQEEQMIKDIVHCGYINSSDTLAQFSNPDALDPRQDPALAALVAAGSNAGKMNKTAAVAKLVVNGYAGGGTIEMGGYDYHDGSRATGEVRDFEAGQSIGATLEYAALMGVPAMVYVFSDGSVASDGQIDNSGNGRGKGVWRGDNSSTASVFFLAYSPNGRPALRSETSGQIGNFTADGSVNTGANVIANNVNALSEAIVLNYMALHDEVGMFEQVLPNHSLGNAQQLDELIAMQPII